MPTIQMEESRRRTKAGASTQVEPAGDPGLEVVQGVHDYVAGETDDQDRTTCAVCGQLWEHKSHNHDAQVPTTPRFTAEQMWVVKVRDEIDGYLVALKKLRSVPPDEVFMELSGMTARLAELRIICMRSESRRLVQLRTRELDPLIEECDRQFRFHSRIQATRQMEADMTRGIT